MMLTYSLRNQNADSNEYYTVVQGVAEVVARRAEQETEAFVSGYNRFLVNACAQETRSRTEYLLELLALGVFWNTYGHAEFLRTRHDVAALLERLDAGSEFTEEVKRLRWWERYLAVLPEATVAAHLQVVQHLANWFAGYSLMALGRYTSAVQTFLENDAAKEPNREDFMLRNRARVEYHLNMVGAALLNSAYRADFLATPRKTLLLPGCMRAPRSGHCAATKVGSGYRCGNCTTECPVNKVAHLGQSWQTETLIVDHGSDVSDLATSTSTNAKTGVVGVACVLNLLSGGWKLRAMGIPAQCVLLDFCGCKKHWHAQGVTTEINEGQLRQIITGSSGQERDS